MANGISFMAMEITTQFLEVAGGRLGYDVTGPADGPLVVCTPGLGDLRQAYRFLVGPLVDAGYRVATMDLRGSGESSADWPSYTPQAIGTDILALVEHLGGRAALIGNSYTGDSVAWLAATAPDAVAGIVMFDPFTRVLPKPGAIMRLASSAVGRLPVLWTMYYRSLYPTAKPADFDTYLAQLRTSLREPGRMAALRAMFAGEHAETEQLLGTVRCPVLVAMGSKDPDFPDPAAEAKEIASRFVAAPARVELIDGAGHYPFAELPDATTPAVLRLLAEAFGA